MHHVKGFKVYLKKMSTATMKLALLKCAVKEAKPTSKTDKFNMHTHTEHFFEQKNLK